MADNTTDTAASSGTIQPVQPEVNAQGTAQFTLPVARSAIAGVEVVDVDLVLVTQGGQRFVLPEAALKATIAPGKTQLRFSDGSTESMAEQLKKVGQTKAVEGGSYRVQATTIKPVQGVSEKSGNDFNLGKDNDDPKTQEQIEQLAQQVQQLSQQAQNAKTNPQDGLGPGNGPGNGPGTGAKASQQLTSQSPGKPAEKQQEKTGTDSNLQAQLFHADTAKLSNIAVADGTEFRQALASKLFAAAPLQVQADGKGAVADQSGSTVGAGLELPALTKASQIQLKLVDGTAPAGLTLNGQSFATKDSSLTLTDLTKLRLAMAWDRVDDGVATTAGQFKLQVVYLDSAGSVSQTQIYTFSYGDYRSASEVPAGTLGLQLRGWSYDVLGTSGNDYLAGGDGHDVLHGLAGDDVLSGGRGDDTLVGGAGADTLDGGTGNNTASYADDTVGVTVNLLAGTGRGGEAQGDVLTNIQNLIGGAGNDQLTGDAQANLLLGGGGNDTLDGGAGSDTLDGGLGNNTASYASSADSVYVDLYKGLVNGGDATGDVLRNVQNLVGSGKNDTLIGNADNNILQGLAGDDSLDGGAGNDTLMGGDGNDTLVGGAGNDSLDGGDGNNLLLGADGNDTLVAGAGNDTLIGGAGADVLDGGAGVNIASYADSAQAVVVNLLTGASTGGDADGDRLSNIQSLTGSAYGDALTGNTDNNSLDGGAGDDTLVGGLGNDTLLGGAGNDVLQGGAGADSLDGGDGIDTASYADSVTNITVSLVDPSQNTGDAQGDAYTSIENLTAGLGNDQLTGDANANVLDGGSGNDTLMGGAGSDTLLGGAGDDVLEGGAGADSLDGGDGNNTASYANAVSGVTVNLADSTRNSGSDAYGDVLTRIQTVIGSAFNDSLTGDLGNNLLNGGGGDDTLVSGSGVDTLIGGGGNDTLVWTDTGTGSSPYVLDGRAVFAQDGDTNNRYQSIETLDLRSNGGIDKVIVDSLMVRALADSGNSSILSILLGKGDSYEIRDETANGITSDVSTPGTIVFKDSTGIIATVLLDQVLTPVPPTDSAQTPVRQVLHDTLYKLQNVSSTQAIDQVPVTSLVASSPLQVTASAALVMPQATPGLGNGTVSLDLVLPGVTSATTATLSLKSALAALPAGFTLTYKDTSGNTVSTPIDASHTAITLQMSGAQSQRVVLSWTVAEDGSTITPTDIVFGVQMFGASGQLSATGNQAKLLDNLTFTYADYRTVADVQGIGNDTNGNAKLYLAARGWSYDVNGTAGNDSINAGDGHDIVRGGAAADTLLGGRGDDTLIGGDGADSLDGGSGNNTASYAGDKAGVTVNLTPNQSGINGQNGAAAGDRLTNIQNLIGGDGGDTLIGDANANRLDGGAGNDTLTGGSGADTLIGGAGSDTADYSTQAVVAGNGLTVSLDARVANTGDAAGDVLLGIENLTGSAGKDRLVGDANANVLTGSAGDDTLEGGAGADTLIGGTGDDTTGGAGSMDMVSYSLSGEAVNANLADSSKNTGGDAVGDVYIGIRGLIGSAYSDTLTGNADANRLEGGAGNDTLMGGAGADTLVGGEGNDTASYATALGAVTANLASAGNNLGDALGDTYDSIENLVGTDFADLLVGNSAKNVLNGGKGDDTLVSGGGGDSLIGGEGKDTVSYASATVAVQAYLASVSQPFNSGAAVGDTFDGIENLTGSVLDDVLAGDDGINVLDGGAGNDTLIGGAGADVLTGGAGTDTASYATAGAAVSLDLTTGGTAGDANGDSYNGIENVLGSAYADNISGNSGDNLIDGGAGDDTLAGGGGNDTLLGGDGDDTLKNTGTGKHTYDGGAGNNTVSYDGFTSALNLSLSRVDGNENGAGGLEVFNNIQNLIGGTLADSLTGDTQNNLLKGGSGNDTLSGLAGNDVLYGDAGDDLLLGGSGADTLNGGDGTDTASYATASAGVRLNLGAPGSGSGDAQGDVLIDIEKIVGSAYNDTFVAGGSKTDYAYDGGSGSDTVSFESSGSAVTVSFQAGTSTGGAAQGATYTSIENLVGSSNDDSLQGDANANNIQGGKGDDLILASLGGNDTLDGGLGDNTADYSAFAAANAIRFDMGVTSNGYYNVTVSGGSQVDQLTSFSKVLGSQGNDTMAGDANDNWLDGGVGNDNLKGAAGKDTLIGGTGNDTLDGGAGADSLDGGDGTDTVSYASYVSANSTGLTVSLAAPAGNTGDAAGDSYANIENITGTAYNDVLSGDTGDNRIDGGAGDDSLSGGAGADTLLGGSGNDTLIGGAGGDSLSGGAGTDVVSYAAITNALTLDLNNTTVGAGSSTAGTDAFGDVIGQDVETIIGATGAATTFLSGTRTAATTLQGDAGQANEVSYANATSGATANLGDATQNAGSARYDRYANILHLTGSGLDDTLTGDANSNLLQGGAGNDTFYATAGNDTVYGGSSASDAGTADSLRFDLIGSVAINLNITGVGAGSASWGSNTTTFSGIETLALTAQADTYTNNSGTGLTVDGLAGNDTMTGGAGNDSLYGSAGNDSLSGGDGNDLLDGGADNDVLDGGAGNDSLLGGAGLDTLTGGAGDDTLVGGAGADAMSGGAGNDVADYSGSAGLTIDMANLSRGTGDAAGDVIGTDIEAVKGSATGDNVFYGRDDASNAESITGGTGNDYFWGSLGADTLSGGNGTDTVDYSGSGSAVTVNLATGTNTGGQAEGDVLSGMDKIIGSANNDSITAGDSGMTLLGGTGNDTLVGGTGADSLQGGGGNDSLTGGAGADTLDMRTGNTAAGALGGDFADAGADDDTVVMAQSAASGSYTLDGGTGTDTLQFWASSSGALDMAAVFGGSNAAKYQNFEIMDLSKDGVNTRVVISSVAIQALVDNINSSVLTLRLSKSPDPTIPGGDTYSIDNEGTAITTTFGNNSVIFYNNNVQVAQVKFEYV